MTQQNEMTPVEQYWAGQRAESKRQAAAAIARVKADTITELTAPSQQRSWDYENNCWEDRGDDQPMLVETHKQFRRRVDHDGDDILLAFEATDSQG